jgi:hypothetical protein
MPAAHIFKWVSRPSRFHHFSQDCFFVFNTAGLEHVLHHRRFLLLFFIEYAYSCLPVSSGGKQAGNDVNPLQPL